VRSWGYLVKGPGGVRQTTKRRSLSIAPQRLCRKVEHGRKASFQAAVAGGQTVESCSRFQATQSTHPGKSARCYPLRVPKEQDCQIRCFTRVFSESVTPPPPPPERNRIEVDLQAPKRADRSLTPGPQNVLNPLSRTVEQKTPSMAPRNKASGAVARAEHRHAILVTRRRASAPQTLSKAGGIGSEMISEASRHRAACRAGAVGRDQRRESKRFAIRHQRLHHRIVGHMGLHQRLAGRFLRGPGRRPGHPEEHWKCARRRAGSNAVSGR